MVYDMPTFQAVRQSYVKEGRDSKVLQDFVVEVGNALGLPDHRVLIDNFEAHYHELGSDASDEHMMEEMKALTLALQRRQLTQSPNMDRRGKLDRTLTGKDYCLAGQEAYCKAETFGVCTSGGCRACASGMYAAGTSNSIRSCTSCPASSYTTNTGDGDQTAGASDASGCLSCASLDWTADGGTLTVKGDASSCTSCASGKVVIASDRSTCVSCVAGQYVKDGCTKCPSGYFTDAAGETACKGCVKGTANPDEDKAGCIDCAPGSYQPDGNAATCKDCEKGRAISTPKQDKECAKCEKGTHQDAEGQAACKDCLAGYFASAVESVSCKDCNKGWYNGDVKQETCIRCAAGKYNELTTQVAEDKCVVCPAGRYSNDANYYNKDGNTNGVSGPGNAFAGHELCNTCPTGQYQGTEGQTTCKDCTSGFYNDGTEKMAEAACKGCEAGYYSKESKPDKASPLENDGYEVCTACPKGYYQPKTTQTLCLATDPGYSTNTTAKTVQDACTPGHYTAKKGCQGCVSATYSLTCLDSVDCVENCQGTDEQATPGGDCPVAYYQPESAQTSCLESTAGHHASYTAEAAHLLLHTDEDKKFHLAQTEQKKCAAGKYNHHHGHERNKVATDGTNFIGPDAFWGISVDKDECIDCPTGKYQPAEGQTSCIMTAAGQYQDKAGGTTFKCARSGWFQPQTESPVLVDDPRIINSKDAQSFEDMGTKSLRDDRWYIDKEKVVQWREFQILPGRNMPEWKCPAGYVSSACMAYCYPDPVLLTIILFSVPACLALLLFIFEEGILRTCLKYKKVFITPESEMTIIPSSEPVENAGRKITKKLDFKLLLYSMVPFKSQLKSFKWFINFRKWCGIKTQKEPPDMNTCPPSPDMSPPKQCLQMLKNKHELVATLFVGRGMKYGVVKRIMMVLFTLTFVTGMNSLLYFASGAAHPDCEEQLPACNAGPFKDGIFRGVIASLLCMPVQAFARWAFADLAPAVFRGERSVAEYYLRFWAFFQITYGLMTICIALFMLAIQNDDMESINSAVVTWPVNQALQIPWCLFTYIVITRRFFSVKEDPDYKKQREWKDGDGGEVTPQSTKELLMSLCTCVVGEVANKIGIDVEKSDEALGDNFPELPEDLQAEIGTLASMTGPWMKMELARVLRSLAKGHRKEAKTHFGNYVTIMVVQGAADGQIPPIVEKHGVPLIAAAAAGDKDAAQICAVNIVTTELNNVLVGEGMPIQPEVLELIAWTILRQEEKQKHSVSALLNTVLPNPPLHMPSQVVRVVVASINDGQEGFEAEAAIVIAEIMKGAGVPESAIPICIAAYKKDIPGAKAALVTAITTVVHPKLMGLGEKGAAVVIKAIEAAIMGNTVFLKNLSKDTAMAEILDSSLDEGIKTLLAEIANGGDWKSATKTLLAAEMTNQGVPDLVVALCIAAYEGDKESMQKETKEAVIKEIKNFLCDKGMTEAGLQLVTSLLEGDKVAAEEQTIELIVKMVLMGKLKMPEELEPVVTAVLKRNKEDAMAACEEVVTEQLKGQVEGQVDAAGLSKDVAALIMAAILTDVPSGKLAMIRLIIEELRKQGAPEEVCTMVQILIEDSTELRSRIEAVAKGLKAKHKGAGAAKVTPQL